MAVQASKGTIHTSERLIVTLSFSQQLPMVNPPDHASYAHVFSQLWETVAPNTLQAETSGTSQQPFELFHNAV